MEHVTLSLAFVLLSMCRICLLTLASLHLLSEKAALLSGDGSVNRQQPHVSSFQTRQTQTSVPLDLHLCRCQRRLVVCESVFYVSEPVELHLLERLTGGQPEAR